MTAERDFVVPESSFCLDGARGTHALDDEAVCFWRLLESLLAAP